MKVFGYCRVSTEGQEDNTSLPMQRERVIAFSKAQGWPAPEVVQEIGSGANIQRPGLQRLRGQLMPGDTLVVLRLDRLFRSVVDGLPFFREMEARGVVIRSVTELLDTGSPMGRLMLTMVLAFATAERELIIERLHSGKKRHAGNGEYNGGVTPYGYLQLVDAADDFAFEEKEAAIVRQLFELYALGRFGITRLKKATGCPLAESAVLDLLSNPFYIGQIRWGGVTKPNKHPAMVSRALFAKVQRVRAERSVKNPRRKGAGTPGETAPAHSVR